MPITVTPSGNPQGEFSTYTPLFSTTLTSAASSITFSNIPVDYTDLVIELTASVTASDNELFMQLGSNAIDTGTNYSTTFFFTDGGSPLATRQSGNSYCNLGRLSVNSAQTTGMAVINLMNYSNPSIYKPVINICGSAATYVYENASLWRNNAPINTIKLYPSVSTFIAGSTFTLYGIRAATPAPKANGGMITTDGSYWYHAFRTSGIFQPTQALTADILVVAGGGPGGAYAGGGGGAGGVLGFASQSLTANTSYSCVVGAGGGGAYNGQPAPKGNDSRFGSLTLVKGGGQGKNGGGVLFSEYENSGGSSGGGGGSGNSGQRTPQSATSGQGYSGGTASSSDSAGGGGAGAVGGGAVGAGGAGATYNTSIGGVSGPFAFINPMGFATGIGHYSSGNWYFGGGGSPAYTSNIAGGVGGGGSGAAYNVQGNVTTRGTDGMANTGGGGGGGGASNNDATTRSMSGGSGVIIVRYAV